MHTFMILCASIYVFLPQACLLSTMVETAWKWAAERGKVKKSEVNGAEYAELEVDRVRTKVSEAESTMSMAAGCVFQDVSVVGCYAILYDLHLFQVFVYVLACGRTQQAVSWMLWMRWMQDNLQLAPVPSQPLLLPFRVWQAFCMHATMHSHC